MSTCKSCGASILWVQMPSKKMMPVDAQAKMMVIVSADKQRGQVRAAHTSHFATCPEASNFRRGRE